MKWSIEIKDESVKELFECLEQGPIIEIAGNEYRSLNEDLVARFGGLTVSVFADEHPPPHFHVKYNGESNSFSLADGTPLYPANGLKPFFKNIAKWYKKNKKTVITAWNNNRPTDCPVGKYDDC